MSTAAGEGATDDIGPSTEEIAKSVSHLFPFATLFVCTRLLESFPCVSLAVPAFASVCAREAPESAAASRECERAVSGEWHEVVNALIPHVFPIRILTILQPIQDKDRNSLES